MIILVNETLLLVMVSLLIVSADQDCYKNNAGEEICKIASDTYDPEVSLSNGVMMPLIGYGTWKVAGDEEIFQVLDAALKTGYRHIDTAVAYNNHRSIAKALTVLLPEYNLKREDLFITSKIPTFIPHWPDWPSLADCKNGLEQILTELDLDYIDLLLIHSPPNTEEERRDAWKCVEDFYSQGKSKAIGVSNYEIHHIEELALTSTISPHVNQIYYNPLVVDKQFDLVSYCDNHKIHVTAYTSLGNTTLNRLINNANIHKIAKSYAKTSAQILLRWSLQQGYSVIPKSLNPLHIKQNKELDFTIEESDMIQISKLFE